MSIAASARRYSKVLLLLSAGAIALARGSMSAGSAPAPSSGPASVTPAAVTSAFTWSPTSPAAGQAVQFTDQSTGSPSFWCWSFGDNSGSSSRNPTHVYAAAGTYNVSLASGDGTSAGNVSHAVVVASTGITAAFTWSPASPTSGQSVQFTDQSTGSPAFWCWNFGDTSSAAVRNPTHTYTAAGTYSVKLIAGSGANSSTTTHSVVVATPVTAAFTWSPTSPTPGQSVQFTDQSTGPRAFWCWNFGDNSSSAAQNPTHAYAASGTYNVSLLTGSGSNTNTTSHAVVVATGVNAAFTWSPASPASGQAVQFTDQSTGPRTFWCWNFGDNSALSLQQNPTHVYAAGGTYNVSLKTGGGSTFSSVSHGVVVATGVNVAFTWSPPSPTPGQTVQFTDQSTGPRTFWCWNFGDNSSSAAQNPTHAYGANGTYTVSLLTGSGSNTNTTSHSIVVATGVSAAFTWSPSSPAAGQTVQFTDQTSGPHSFWCWNFGDNSSSAVQNPTHVYAANGTYSVKLATGGSAGTSSVTHSIAVAVPLNAAFTWSPTSPSAGQSVQFTDQSTGPRVFWCWNFGDNTSSDQQNPAHAYGTSGTYTVRLLTGGSSGNGSASHSLTVGTSTSPAASFTWSPSSPAAGQTVQFTDQTTGSHSFWCWNFGDNSSSALQNPTHVYAANGTYDVRLLTGGSAGNSTASHPLVVGNSCDLACSATVQSAANVNDAVQFVSTATPGNCGSATPSYAWNFGDGATSSAAVVAHVYTAPGPYDWSFTATVSGTTCSKSGRIMIGVPAPACALTCSANVAPSATVDSPVTFTASSAANACGGTPAYTWKFGDNATASGANVSHAYGSSGIFNWTLTVAQDGATCSRNGSVSVLKPVSNQVVIDYFKATPDQIAAGATSELAWSVRNAKTVTLDSVGSVPATSATTVQPLATTTYHLTASNDAGSQTATATVRVDPALTVAVRADRLAGNVPLDVTFTALVSGGVPQYRYRWSFGDTTAQTTHRWTTAANEDVTCTITDAHGTSKTSSAVRIIASPKQAGVLVELRDQTPGYGGVVRSGAAADGTTNLEVRATTSTPGKVTFTFQGRVGSGLDGGLLLSSTSTAQPVGSLTVHTAPSDGHNVASVTYRVPSDYAPSDYNHAVPLPTQRAVELSAHLAGDDGSVGDYLNVPILLGRPPVVFVRGLWSDQTTWDHFQVAQELFGRDVAVRADWDGETSIASGATQVLPYFRNALQKPRALGLAATRVDVVAHSMGGLITRRIVASGNDLVHKLITLDTPHAGSLLADWLIAHEQEFFATAVLLPVFHHHIHLGAVDDLRVNTTAAQTARTFSIGRLRGHSIIGIASDEEPCTTTDLATLVAVICGDAFWGRGLGYNSLAECRSNLVTDVLNHRRNDEIVDDHSQRGGMSDAAVTQFVGSAGSHTCPCAHENIKRDNKSVSDRVNYLLDSPVTGSLFQEYSASAAQGIASPMAAVFPELTGRTRLIAADAGTVITSPQNGSNVLPGGAVDVAVTAADSYTQALIITPDQVITLSERPFVARVDVPVVAIGAYPITALVANADGSVTLSDQIALSVKPEAAVDSLVVSPLEIVAYAGDTITLRVQALFTDAVAREITHDAGTTFSSSDTAVATVDDQGAVTAHAPGTAVIEARNGAARASVPVTVSVLERRRAAEH